MKKKLGEILVASGAVTPADVEAALSDQRLGEPARLGDLLVSMGKLSTHQLARALAQQHGVPFTELPPIPSSILDLVPLDFQRQFRFVPLKVSKGAISIAMADLSHAATDVLPVLRRRFPQVQIFVAPGDAIDAVHTAVTGAYEGPPPSPGLPSVAPVIAPVVPRVPSKTEEIFAAIELDLHGDARRAPTPGAKELGTVSFELEGPPSFPAPPPRPVSLEPPMPAVAARPSAAPASRGPGANRPTASSPASPGPAVDGRPRATAWPDASGDDRPFFADAAPSAPVAPLNDRAFVDGIPMSSASSLAALVIEPEPAALPIAPPPDLMVTVATARASSVQARPGSSAEPLAPPPAAPALASGPGPAPPSAPPARTARSTIPEWLQATDTKPEVAVGAWTGALDALAPSKLILAVTKVLLSRGLLTEAEILEASEAKKK